MGIAKLPVSIADIFTLWKPHHSFIITSHEKGVVSTDMRIEESHEPCSIYISLATGETLALS